MISVAFINDGYEPLLASDPFISFEKMVLETTNEVDSIIAGFSKIHDQYMIESEIMGELDDEKSLYLEAEKSNVFDKIGKGVIKITEAFIDAIKKIIEWITSFGFRSKSQLDKMEEGLNHLKHNDPKKYKKFSEMIIAEFHEGHIPLNSAKSIKEVNEMMDEIIELSKQKDIKPNTLRAKVEAMKKKIDKIEDGKTNKVSKVVKNVITAAVAIATLRSTILKSKKDIIDCQKAETEQNKALIDAINARIDMGGTDDMTIAQILRDARIIAMKKNKELYTAEQGNLKKLDNGITKWLFNFEKSKKDKTLAAVARNTQMMNDEKQKDRDAERDKNYQDAYDKARGQNKGHADSILNDSSVRKATKQEARLKAQAQARAQRYENDKAVNHNTQHQNAIRRQAELQEEGKSAVRSNNP